MPHYGPLILPEKAYPLAQPLDTSVVLAGTAKPKKQKRKQVVLDEDTYVKTLDTIITRDYFPALQPLETLLTGGRPSTRSVRPPSSVRSSLNGSFEEDTPDVRPRSPGPLDLPSASASPPPEPKPETKLSLDQFTANFTSEDNEAFEQLIEAEEKRREQRVFWVEEHAKEAAKNIINRLEEPKRTGDNVTQYEPSAHLPQKAIVAENTRFPGGFFDKPTVAEEQKLQEAAVPSTPMVGKYKLLRTPTPSIAAGEEIMTWGDIIGTPLHLKNEDVQDDYKPNTREFRVPATPARDEVLHRLDAQSKERNKHITGRRLTTPGNRTPQTPMSPAARAMLRNGSKVDMQLRASYGMTPTPTRTFARPTPRNPRTPLATPLIPTPSPLR